jgi:hypothetical protein
MYVVREPQDDDIPSIGASEEKTEKWKKWATLEVQNKAVLGHYVLDGQISQFSGCTACARHVTNPLTTPESDGVFAFTTPDAWIPEMQKPRPRRRSLREVFVSIFTPGQSPMDAALSNLSICVVLEDLQSLAADVQEVAGPAVGTPSSHAIMCALIHLYGGRLARSDASAVENLKLLVRWHSICLRMATPTSMLCRKLCAFYGIQQQLYAENNTPIKDLDLGVWARSVGGPEGGRCCMRLRVRISWSDYRSADPMRSISRRRYFLLRRFIARFVWLGRRRLWFRIWCSGRTCGVRRCRM